MTPPAFHRQLWSALRGWWREQSRQKGAAAASTLLVHELWTFLRTTSGTVGWRERLLGVFHSPYQPTDAALFQEMMSSLPIDFSEFTFVDLGSGKGRTLLMASEYPFRRIVGVEILPELHRAAEENIANYQSTTQQCTQVESVCADASEFELPEGPLLLYLFNPLPETGLIQILENLEESLRRHPRIVYVLYQNPLPERVLEESPSLKCTGGTHQYSIHTNAE